MSRQIVRCNWCDWVDYEDELLPDELGIPECECPSCNRQENLMDVDYGCTFDDKQIEKLWDLLEDVPFDEDEEGRLVLAEDWFGFTKGIDRETIWYWFDENYSSGLASLMYGEKENLTMKNYKEFDKVFIGGSDIASLILVGCDENGALVTQPLNFGQDDVYNAYIVDEKAEIGSHYKEVAKFSHWMKIYDDHELVHYFRAKEIKVYRAGEMGCIVQLIGKEK